ncbi:hypothetical protein F5Y09DRAFT_354693 [Xylaria sp. FL1042]|nr:hypothetical protein F5Y09DRAFT_354693 [Xylaria sp. FL1042]
MGLAHPIHIVGMVGGKVRPLAAIQIGSADPRWNMVIVVKRILTYFKDSENYVNLELAFASSMSDDDWTRDPHDEYRAFSKEMKECEKREIWERKELLDAKGYVPKFPLVHTCLLLGAISSWKRIFGLISLYSIPWNAAPGYGGKYMWEPGCTIINITDYSYCFVLPPYDSFSTTKKRKRKFAKLACRPISAHQWLSAFGLESEDPKSDEIGAYGTNKCAPIISTETLQQLNPIFVYEEESDEDGDEDDNEDEDDDEEENDDENDNQNQRNQREINAAEAPTARKRDREPEPLNARDESAIEEILLSNSKPQLTINKRRKGFLATLKRFTRECPERFRAECPGAVQLLLSALTQKQGRIIRLDISRFTNLSGIQVVDIVKGVVSLNAKHTKVDEAHPKPLALLNISFINSVTPDHLASILDLTDLDELLIWHNPCLPLDEVATLAKGRIAKTTTRARFMEPLERQAMQLSYVYKLPPRAQPSAPLITLTHTPIRQVVWMNLMTSNLKTTEPLSFGAVANQPQALPGKLSLEHLSIKALATMMHPEYSWLSDRETPNKVFAEFVPLQLHDIWMPLAEFYTSLQRIEIGMVSNTPEWCSVDERWPMIFPLMMATGNTKSWFTVSSPFPAEAFEQVCWQYARHTWKKTLQTRGSDAIIHGEYTAVFLHESDLGRLRYGLVTRDAQGQMQVCDPAEVGDAAARRAWANGIGGLTQWADKEQEKGEVKEKKEWEIEHPGIALFDVGAVEHMFAAAEQLVSRQDEIKKQISCHKYRPRRE